jgi:hypothetical protein
MHNVIWIFEDKFGEIVGILAREVDIKGRVERI